MTRSRITVYNQLDMKYPGPRLFLLRAAAMLTWQRVTSLALTLAALYAFGYAALVVGVRVWFESHPVYNIDVPLYWTVGRGIVEGYVPYRDLFETKPPGIFLISAVSYAMTGDFKLTNVLQVVSLVVIAGSPVFFLRRLLERPRELPSRLSVGLALWSAVLVLTAYAGHYADMVQVELYGLAAMVGYMLLLGKPGRWAFASRALCVACAIGMKEPFLLMVPAVYVVLRRNGRRDIADCWGPLLAAGLGGSLFLLLAGWFGAFVKLYLGAMVGGHVQLSGSPFDRALQWDLTWENLTEYSPFLPYLLLYCVLVFIGSGTAAQRGTENTSRLQRAQAVFAALLLSWLAVGMGGTFFGHHFVLAVPLYLAVLYSLMSDLCEGGERRWFKPGLIALALLAPVWAPISRFDRSIHVIAAEDQRAREAAVVIDNLLDRLGVDRYLWLGPGGYVPYPFTRHAPLGPMFFQQSAFFEGKYPKWMTTSFEQRLDEARVVVVEEIRTGPLDERLSDTLRDDFERVPPKVLPREFPYKVYVRNGLLAHVTPTRSRLRIERSR